jgi:hypothetical protein
MWEDVRRCEDEKMRRRWEDEKMWSWEDVKMWRWDVKRRRCEDERMWRWDVKMRRRWEEDEMWRWEDVLQTPTIGRTLRSDALGNKSNYIYKNICNMFKNVYCIYIYIYTWAKMDHCKITTCPWHHAVRVAIGNPGTKWRFEWDIYIHGEFSITGRYLQSFLMFPNIDPCNGKHVLWTLLRRI